MASEKAKVKRVHFGNSVKKDPRLTTRIRQSFLGTLMVQSSNN